MGKAKRVERTVAGIAVFFAMQVIGLALMGAIAPVAGVAASDLSRSFNSKEKIEVGSLVSLDKQSDGYVVAASTDNEEQLAGVAVLADNSLLAVNTGASKAQVAISGQATALVSTLNGNINPGDLIAASPFAGIGAKALPGDRVVGIAQAGFSGGSATLKTTTVTDRAGNSNELKIGRIPVVVSVGTMASSGSEYGVNSGLQGFATNIAGKPVSVVRLAIALIIGVAALVSLMVVVYGTIRNGISAVARNPLAKPAIFDSMAQVMVMIAFISVVAIILMYAVLRI